MKIIGLAAAGALALSGTAVSRASAETTGFNSEGVQAGESAYVQSGQIGTDTLTLGSRVLSCTTAKAVGRALEAGPEPSEVTLEPTYEGCQVVFLGITKPATVTTNGCAYRLSATKNTAETALSADLRLECPEEGPKQIELHTYNDEAHTETLCTYDIEPQSVENQIQLTEEGSDTIEHLNLGLVAVNTNLSFVCSNEEEPTMVYEGEDTLQLTSHSGSFTAAVGSEEVVHIHGEGNAANPDEFTLGSGNRRLECESVRDTGQPVDASGNPQRGPQPTYVTLESTYEECRAVIFGIAKFATVTTNGCAYRLDATRGAEEFHSPNAITPYSADLAIECPEEGPEQIEIHLYNDGEHTEALCAYDIQPQSASDQIELTGEESDIAVDFAATIEATNTVQSFACVNNSTITIQHHGEHTLRATDEVGNYVNSAVS